MTEAQIAAIAGEHHVAHKIAMLGYVPTLIHQRMPRMDLLVSLPNLDKTVGLQIRTSANATREVTGDADPDPSYTLRFPLGQRAITTTGDNMFFCFVDLRRMSPSTVPDVYVLPAATVRQEYEGVYTRKYSQLHYERPWRALQPFRNNWAPVSKALSAEEAPQKFARALTLSGFGRALDEKLVPIHPAALRAG